MLKLKEIQSQLDKEFVKLKFPSEPASLYQPIQYILENGGKRIRPSLTLLAASLFSDDYLKALPQAVGLEVFHNFTLLHDDIMDKAEVRRNQPTVHKKWNENVAILSGDAMLIEAYKFISDADASILPDVLKIFNKTALEVCEGQQFDMDFEDRLDVTEDEYIEMIRLKTSVLLAACLRLGAIVGGADKKSQRYLYDFGINVGIGFQLKDDFLDSYGDPKVFGKKIGGDIVSNKKTFLLIKALELSIPRQKDELLLLLSDSKINPDIKIRKVKDIYKELEIDVLTRTKMEEYYNKGVEILNEVPVEESKKQELYSFAQTLIQRDK